MFSRKIFKCFLEGLEGKNFPFLECFTARFLINQKGLVARFFRIIKTSCGDPHVPHYVLCLTTIIIVLEPQNNTGIPRDR